MYPILCPIVYLLTSSCVPATPSPPWPPTLALHPDLGSCSVSFPSLILSPVNQPGSSLTPKPHPSQHQHHTSSTSEIKITSHMKGGVVTDQSAVLCLPLLNLLLHLGCTFQITHRALEKWCLDSDSRNLFFVLVFWPQGMCDLSSLTRDWTCNPCIPALEGQVLTTGLPEKILVTQSCPTLSQSHGL